MNKRNGLPPVTKGILCILIAGICFTFMNAFVRLAGDLNTFEKAFFRNLVALIIAFFVLKAHHEKIEISKEVGKLLLLRAFFGTIGVIGNFYAVDHLVLSDASMLAKMSPFYTILLCHIILKERATPVHFGLMIVALAGAMLIVKPSAGIFSHPASLIALIGGMGEAGAYVILRLLGLKGVNRHLTVFVFSAVSCLAMIPLMLPTFRLPDGRQLVCLLMAGLCAAGGQYGLTFGYGFAAASQISIFDYSQVIFNAILGYFLFDQLADAHSMIGYVIIIGAAIAMAVYNNRREGAGH